MRTSIFNNYPNLSPKFETDFHMLWDFSNEERIKLINSASDLFRCETSNDIKLVLDNAVKIINGNSGDILKVLNILKFIYNEWNPVNDTPENFVTDLMELSLIPKEKEAEAQEFLFNLFSRIEQDNDYRVRKSFSNTLLPSYIGADTLIDFRAVIKNPYGLQLDENVESYKPICIGYVPVVIVGFERDSGTPTTFEFQCEESSLKRLIQQLQSALKDLESAKKAIPGD